MKGSLGVGGGVGEKNWPGIPLVGGYFSCGSGGSVGGGFWRLAGLEIEILAGIPLLVFFGGLRRVWLGFLA